VYQVREVRLPQADAQSRDFLRRAGIIAATAGVGPAFVAACSSTATKSGPASASGGTVKGGAINFWSWQGYDLLTEPAVKSWRAANHVSIHSGYVGTHDEITAKFTTGGGKGVYNLSTYEAGYGPFYVSLGIPSALDMSKIPNFAQVYPIFRSGPIFNRWWRFNGHQWCCPFTWGLQGINYDATKIKTPTSYTELMGPTFKGKIGVTDDIVAAFVIGAHALGIFKANSLYTPSQVSKIIGFWTQLKKNARLIVPSYGNMAYLFVAGEIVSATPGWSAVNTFAAQKGDNHVTHVIPSEGAATFCDGFMIPSQASDPDAAYAYINEAFSPEAQAQEAEALVQAVVNPKALPLMNSATRALYPYDQLDTVLTSRAPLEAIPVKVPSGYASFADWENAWTAFKA